MLHYFFILVLISPLVYGQNDIEGSWKKNSGRITILSTDDEEDHYYILHNKHAFLAKKDNNSLCFYNQNDIKVCYKNIEVKEDILALTIDNIAYTYQRDTSFILPKINAHSLRALKKSFFDYSTDKPYASDFYDLTAKGPLPFYINRSFIQNEKLDSITIELCDIILKDSIIYKERTTNQISLYFNDGLLTKTVMVKPAPKTYKDSIVWEYHYSDLATLDSISIPGGTLVFEDNFWPLDQHGFRKWNHRKRPSFWEYDEKGLPIKCLKTYGKGFVSITKNFVYNQKGDLVEIREKRVGEGEKYYSGYNISYSKQGIPLKISAVTFW